MSAGRTTTAPTIALAARSGVPFRLSSPLIQHASDWRAVISLNCYRFLIAFGLVAVLITGAGAEILDPVMPGVFRAICLLYLAQCALAMAASLARRPGLQLHVVSVIAIDVLCISGLTLASSGVVGGLGMLLIAPLAAGGMLLPGRIAALLGACAVIAILGQEVWRPLAWPHTHSELVQAGILGMLYFAAVAIAHWLTRRVQRSEAFAADWASEARDLTELNRRIIQQMQTGAIVVDPAQRISLINDAALDLLDLRASDCQGRPLVETAPVLADALKRWLDTGETGRPMARSSGRTLFPVFSTLDSTADAPVLIFIEDAQRQNERAQQIKLMSIGRLTASIAHEIRNPLGAISHAGQLLAESPNLGRDEARLLEIIHRHSQRIDVIITHALGLSRRTGPSRESIALAAWLRQTIADYRQYNAAAPVFCIDEVEQTLRVAFDPDQLRQVLFNLWDNAQRYARCADRPLRLRLSTTHNRAGHLLLEVADNGPGIDADIVEQILEPFFTTARDGTGLGLHIAREICEANGAELAPVARSVGACFRITFAHAMSRQPTPALFPAEHHP